MPSLMKGNVWAKRKHKMTYPCTAEIKHDEIRVHVKYNGPCEPVQFLSYAGKPLKNLGQFGQVFHKFFRDFPEHTELDCGFEANGNFADSYRWVRSNGIPDDLQEVTIKFFLFDIMSHPDATYRERCFERKAVVMVLSKELNIEFPGHWYCYTEADVDAAFLKAREMGYEGLMVKSNEHLYHSVPARTDGWLKMKPEDTADGYITGLNEAVSIEGIPLGRTGSVSVRCEDGSVASPAGVEHDLGRQMHESPDRFLGQWVEFKYMERDRAGGYRHPSFIRFREPKV